MEDLVASVEGDYLEDPTKYVVREMEPGPYYGSDEEEILPHVASLSMHPRPDMLSTVPPGVKQGDIIIPAQYIYDKLNSIEKKIDSVMSSLSDIEKRQQATHDMMIILQRSLPRYTTPAISQHRYPIIERRLQ
ncbi:hypothetical protein DMN91_001156 [Ooceraea biroi]|uniref:Uncharacterized protein n=1 Tax=Ooceraea biroi TaxID=2015173 RepID=A0A3L8E4K8_OOCBI|nr:uncharacterized protein LOC105280380 [Ooceraea biroi]RLU27355.1 hypothetical protein DMN91_001156 [Ooceraea biroi]